MLLVVERKEKEVPLCISEAILRFAAKNISVLAKSPALRNISNDTFIELIQNMS